MRKSPDAFRSIGEVSQLVGVAPHVLRYWEGQFTQLSPVKRADGRRYYRPDDIRLAAGLCQILREDGMSIRGVKRLIAQDRGAALRQIGAQRLGEGTGENPPPAPPITALIAAKPESRRKLPAAKTPAGGNGADAPAPRRRKAGEDGQSLPLFPDLDRPVPAAWLGRLVATAGSLRGAEPGFRPVEKLRPLRHSLNEARAR